MLVACLLIFSTLISPLFAVKPHKTELAPLVIRVGAMYYDDDKTQYSRIESILSALSRRDRQRSKALGRREIVFKQAVGTYDEVLNWYLTDQIDLAIMNPGPVAVLLDKLGESSLKEAFVGIRKRAPSDKSLAYSISGKASRDKYHSVIMLNKTAVEGELINKGKKPTYQNVIELLREKKGKVHFFFVHPLSTSGYIFPRALLENEEHISLDESDYELTYSHDVSVWEVANRAYDKNGRLNVAFVSDETAGTDKSSPNITLINDGRMTQDIVQDALFLTPEFLRKEAVDVPRVKDLLQERVDKSEEMFDLVPPTKLDDWKAGYQAVRTWLTNVKQQNPTTLTLDQIMRRITNYDLHHDKPARLAIVLSGGGAKCAYQLGAVEEIEDKLDDSSGKDHKLKIDLVVGTSGGAINALTVAAGATSKGSGKRGDLHKTWENFDQTEILKPSDSFRRLIGVTVGLLFSFFLVYVWYLARRWLLFRKAKTGEARIVSKRRRRVLAFATVGGLLLLVTLGAYLVGLSRWDLTKSGSDPEYLLANHNWIHLAEYGRQSLRWMAVPTLFCGLILCVASLGGSKSLLSRYGAHIEKERGWAFGVVSAIALLLVVTVVYTTGWVQQSLFVSEGIEEKMACEIPALLNATKPEQCSKDALPALSSEITSQGLIKRDLVITGSILPDPAKTATPQPDTWNDNRDNDSDLYFYYQADATKTLPDNVMKDSKFVNLRGEGNEGVLLDAVIGSGAIYPAFEPHKIVSLKRVKDSAEQKGVPIIDGGFIHNSPIEAAVELGATHIIVIEASPEDQPAKEQNLWRNTLAAFNYLFTQAQLLDARSRRQAEVFTLRPATPKEGGAGYLCTLDFGAGFIDHAMKLGREDASCAKGASFKRQPRPAALD